MGEPAEYLHPRLAPDEARIAVARLDAQTGAYDIWLIDAMRPASLRFTFDSANERFPTWSPDGKWIAFASPGRQTLSDVFMKPSNGTGKDELLVSSHVTKFPTDWSPDGQWLVYHEALQSTGYDPGVGVQYGKDFAVSADGQRFLVNTRLPTSNGSPITVILNWTQALK